MEKNYCHTKVGNHVIEDIYMLDDTSFESYSCNIMFFPMENNNGFSRIEVEYCFVDDSWCFVESFYNKRGNLMKHNENGILSEEEKQKCKDIINEFILGLS